MKLKDVLQGVPLTKTAADLACPVTGISHDSRAVKPGELFIAVPGFADDGQRYIPDAAEKGAAAVLCRRAPRVPCPYLLTEDPRRAMAVAGANFFRHPAREMTMLGVTGTCGKTTTTYFLKAILENALGAKTGLLGTNQNMIGARSLPTERTTPESLELQRLFRRMADAGCTHAVMEVSSHALALDRVYGIDYTAAVFTNLTQDHLDFHKTMESYCDAKAILFQNCRRAVVNGDDPWSRRLLENSPAGVTRFGLGEGNDLRAADITLTARDVSFTALYRDQRQEVLVHSPGQFTVYNALAALGAAAAVGVPLADAARALSQAPPVQGRAEVVPTPGRDYTVLIDFAHTPESMAGILKAVRGFARGRTVAVFGCGGDRDKTKRPLMGKAAAQWADMAVVTTDNPRTEDPEAIIRDILPGFDGFDTPRAVVPDRVQAIRFALDSAKPGDVIVLCGKGHETYQEINGEKHPLDEREIVAAHLATGKPCPPASPS